jgi:hypothetical protein
MPPLSRHRFLSFAALAAAFAAPVPARASAAKERCVFQVSDADMSKWNLTLGNVMNARAALGPDGVELEIVAFGPGVDGLKAGSPAAARIAEVMKAGVPVYACQNTMHARNLTAADLLPGLGFVPSGVVEVMRRQREGWSYIRS